METCLERGIHEAQYTIKTGIVGDMLTCGSTYVRTCGHTLRYPAIGMPLGSTAHADAYVYESGLLLHSSVSRVCEG